MADADVHHGRQPVRHRQARRRERRHLGRHRHLRPAGPDRGRDLVQRTLRSAAAIVQASESGDHPFHTTVSDFHGAARATAYQAGVGTSLGFQEETHITVHHALVGIAQEATMTTPEGAQGCTCIFWGVPGHGGDAPGDYALRFNGTAAPKLWGVDVQWPS